LASILWWHDSIVVVQIFLFVSLGLYALDLLNFRDGIAVGVWIGALIMTIASGFGTLLQVDDTSATGASMIKFLLQLAVEGMSFCIWVSGIIVKNVVYLPFEEHPTRPCTVHSYVPANCGFCNHQKSIVGLLDYTSISVAI
jgi:hypothetical protein